jgi:antitoxin HicB
VVIEQLCEADGGGYLAAVPELPGCMSDRATRAEALGNVEDAIITRLHVARKHGWTIAEPTRAVA